MIPTKKFCEACSIQTSCQNKVICNIDFIDWEKYKAENMPESQTKRCDLILDTTDKVCLIEMKAKDWLDENKEYNHTKYSSVIHYFYRELFNKFASTLEECSCIVSNLKHKSKKYSIIFSKYHSIGWHSDELTSAQIKYMLNTRVFLCFNNFNIVDRTFNHNGETIKLDARECSEIASL